MSSSTNKTEYQSKYENFIFETYKNKKFSACDKLLEFRTLLVALDQIKNTYWRRPCWRDWPCPFGQHRSEINKLKERLAPLEKKLQMDCAVESNIKVAALMQKAIDANKPLSQNIDAKATAKSSGSYVAQGDINYNNSKSSETHISGNFRPNDC